VESVKFEPVNVFAVTDLNTNTANTTVTNTTDDPAAKAIRYGLEINWQPLDFILALLMFVCAL
jgi:hypothetical protein